MRWQAVSNWFDPPPQPGSPQPRLGRRMFWAGLIVRIAFVTLAHTYRMRPYSWGYFGFGWEAGRIARAVALGHGYSDPFIWVRTGPTAWLPPLFPLMIAACFKLFGVYSSLAG